MSRTRSSRRNPIGVAGFLAVALLLAVGAVWSHQRLLGGIYTTRVGVRPARERAAATAVKGGGPLRALIFHSTATARFTGNEPHQRALAQQWQDLLATEQIATDIISEWPSTEARSHYDLLILPAVVCMSDADKEWVKDFLRSGRGVIMTWAAGVRDEQGAWRSQSLLAHVAGLSLGSSPPLSGTPARATMALTARTPLTYGLPPGLPLLVHAYGEPLAGLLHEPRVQSSATWRPAADHAISLQTAPLATTPAAIVHGSYYSGRFVWLGFSDLGAVTHPDAPQAATRIAHNALRWASRRPRASKPLWPQRADSGFSLSMAVREKQALDSPLWELVRMHRLPVTLFVADEVWTRQPDFADALPSQVELALLDEQPARRAEPFALRPETRRLHTGQRKLVSNRARRGYRAADGTYVEELLTTLVRARFDFVVAGSAAIHPRVVRSFRPVPFVTRAHEMWQLPEIRLSDLLIEDDLAVTGLTAAFDAVQQAGGYFNLWLDGDTLDTRALARLDLFFHQVKQRNTWLASVGTVHDFWRQWGHIDIATTHDRIGRTTVHISNSGQQTVQDALFYIDMDGITEHMDLQPLTLGSPATRILQVDATRWEVHVSRIPPGKNFSYQLEFR